MYIDKTAIIRDRAETENNEQRMEVVINVLFSLVYNVK